METKIDKEIKKGIKKKINKVSSLVGIDETLLDAELNNAPDCFQKVAKASSKYKNCIADEMRVDEEEGWSGEQAYFRESRKCRFFLENLHKVKEECLEEVYRKITGPPLT